MKKKFRFVLLSAAFAGAVLVSCNDDDSQPAEDASCIPATLQDGLVAAYTFGNGSLADAVGSADLTLAGNVQPGADREGNPHCAFVFDGEDTSYLSTQNVAALNGLGEMTLSFWHKPEPSGGGMYQSLITTKLAPPYAPGYWSVGTYDCLKAVFASVDYDVWENDITTGDFTCEGEINQRAGVWDYITVTYSQSGNQMAIYSNGVLQNTGPLNTVAPTSVGELYIGKGYKGSIDDIAFYNKILTQAEITQLYELEACCQ